MKHLKYCIQTAQMLCGEKRHAQEVMKELGITYRHCTAQSMFDQWWFWNCDNIPDILPKYLSVLNRDPMKEITN
jgi:NADH:ubiquinone oxidoreductase subunit E